MISIELQKVEEDRTTHGLLEGLACGGGGVILAVGGIRGDSSLVRPQV